MDIFDEFKVLVTVTGFKHYPNAKRLLEGDKVTLCRETENQFDESAISVYSEFGKIGYVANSKERVIKGTLRAKHLAELIDTTALAYVVEGGYYEAVCEVVGIYDVDKMILKASALYNKGEYESAVPLFLKLTEKYSSIMLLQYTADCLIKTDKFEDALEYLNRAAKIEEDNKVTLMMYATSLNRLKRYEEAIKIYKRLLAITKNKLVEDALDECIRLSRNEDI